VRLLLVQVLLLLVEFLLQRRLDAEAVLGLQHRALDVDDGDAHAALRLVGVRRSGRKKGRSNHRGEAAEQVTRGETEFHRAADLTEVPAGRQRRIRRRRDARITKGIRRNYVPAFTLPKRAPRFPENRACLDLARHMDTIGSTTMRTTHSFQFVTRMTMALGAVGALVAMASSEGCGPGDTRYYCDATGCYNCDGYGCHPVNPPPNTKCTGTDACAQ